VQPDAMVHCWQNQIGEIWVRGPSSPKLLEPTEETAGTFDSHLVDTGEGPFCARRSGFLWGGELFIAGRVKDLIIIRA